jgi:hypothetical protein
MYVIKVVICSCEVDPVGGELFPASEAAMQEINGATPGSSWTPKK